MLHFFPTPYPDETWYSLICRYHIHSGNGGYGQTWCDLFGNANPSLTSAFPNEAVKLIVNQLPDEIMDVKTALLNHTLFLYKYRATDVATKMAILAHPMGIAHGSTASDCQSEDLSYCPVCRDEDIQLYGEPYWHLSHQITMMSTCTKHRCALVKQSIHHHKNARVLYEPIRFCREAVPQFVPATYDNTLDEYLLRCLQMPIQYGKRAQNVLYDAVLKKYSFWNGHINYWQLERDAVKRYGRFVVDKCFGNTPVSSALGRVKKWQPISAGRHAMLAALINFPIDEVFAAEEVDIENSDVLAIQPY